MRVSDIQRRRSLPTQSQPIPPRRAALWLGIAAAIAAGIYLYFRYAHALVAVLEY